MRRLFTFVLCLALALQGVAQARVVEQPCPMQKRMHAHGVHAAKTAHHCCNDAATAAKTGKACKTGQACAAAGAWLMSSQSLCTSAPLAVSSVSSFEPFALSIDFGGRWRPPALS
jgi:hypothetical protein